MDKAAYPRCSGIPASCLAESALADITDFK